MFLKYRNNEIVLENAKLIENTHLLSKYLDIKIVFSIVQNI